jgi:hypothetical protein
LRSAVKQQTQGIHGAAKAALFLASSKLARCETKPVAGFLQPAYIGAYKSRAQPF